MMNKPDLTVAVTAEQIAAIQAQYEEEAGFDNFSCLLMGLFGVGKTTFIGTGRRPILIDSFDPRGTMVLKDLIDSGDVFVRTYWNENFKKPTEYARWEKQWEKDIASGFFDHFGTYAIDSATTFIEALSNYVSTKKGRPDGSLAIQDYNPIYHTVRSIVKMTSASAKGCDFILTGHLVHDKDEMTSEITAELHTYKGLKTIIPLLFTEKYVLVDRDTGTKGVIHELLTARKGRYRASTQIGRDGKFNREEVPDIKHLLRKAGLPAEDKARIE